MGLVKSLYEAMVIVSLGARAAFPQLDTIHTTRSLFTWRDAVLAGSFAVATVAIRPLDKRAANSMQNPNRQQSWIFQQASTVVRTIAQPGSVIIGTSMYAIGRLSHTERLAEVGLHG